MKIGIDATGLHPTGGPTTYTKNLILGLGKLKIQDEIIVYTRRKFQDIFPERHIPPLIPRLVREGIYLPYIYKKDKLDVIIEPKGYAPRAENIRKVVVIHDIIPLENPVSESIPARIYWKYTIPGAVKYADWIITVSEWSKKQIVRRFPGVIHKISVIPTGIDTEIKEDKDALQKIGKQYPIQNGYILFVGTIKFRKNIRVLIKAFEHLKRDGLKYKLILVGRYEYGSKKIIRLAHLSTYKDDIIFTGPISEKIRDALYQKADIFVYPSIEEGFGLPVLEAMKLGIPVITTEIDSIKEVGGDTVLYFNGRDVSMLSHQIKRLFIDEKFRKILSIKEKNRVKNFFSLRLFTEKIYHQILLTNRLK